MASYEEIMIFPQKCSKIYYFLPQFRQTILFLTLQGKLMAAPKRKLLVGLWRNRKLLQKALGNSGEHSEESIVLFYCPAK